MPFSTWLDISNIELDVRLIMLLQTPSAMAQVSPGFYFQSEYDDLSRFALDTMLVSFRRIGDQQVSTTKRRVEDAADSM